MQEKKERKPHSGDFAKGNSKSVEYGKLGGRPKGSKNKFTAEMLEGKINDVQIIVEKVYEAAAAGDMTAARLFLDKYIPNAKERCVNVDIPAIKKLADIEEAQNKVTEHINNGDITLAEADCLDSRIERHRKFYETQLLETIKQQAEDTAKLLEEIREGQAH